LAALAQRFSALSGFYCLSLILAPIAHGEDRAEIGTEAWVGIRVSHEAARHVAAPTEGGYRAHNPGQHWSTRFDGRGFRTVPDTGGWAWGLELEHFGFVGNEVAVTEPLRVTATGGRIAYEWSANLEEWYVNDSRGLEHGFTVRQRPSRGDEGAEQQLTFTLAVRGSLQPQVEGDGRDVHFLRENGESVLTYSGLTVFDADGRLLEASFESVDEGLRLRIDESCARYPLTVDPVAQQAYLKASNTDIADSFGESVAISGDTVVVGATGEGSNATGVNGDQLDNSAQGAGAAYVFVRTGSAWSQQAYLKASNTDWGDSFGQAVTVSGDTAVVGAFGEASSATGMNGNKADNSAVYAGAAYVYVRSGTSWSQQAYVKASNTDWADRFGWALSLSGDTLVVGAFMEDSNATGVDGNQASNSAADSGAAYVFLRNGTTWSQQAYLKASNTAEGDEFGWSVAVHGDAALVGARSTGYSVGSAYLFLRSGTTWTHDAFVEASNSGIGDDFGWSAALSDDLIVIGAPGESSSSTGVNGDESDNSATEAGAAYVFELDLEPPGSPYCFGDPGSGTPCPCNNDNDGSVPGSGCDNGVFASGAQLLGSGQASLASDTLVLTATHVQPNTSGLFFQADNDLSPSLVWGDGLRCAGGSLKRIQVRFSDASGTSYTTKVISTKVGNITAGVTKYYQCWYRSDLNPPCGLGVNDFNASNGYAVTWTP